MYTRWRAFWRAVIGRRRLEAEMDAELRFHIECYVEDLVGSGVPRAEAERRARLEFGGMETAKEDCRQALGLRLVDELRQDLRYAIRSLRRTPAFTAIAITALALGIGATSTVFSVVNAVILRPLRVPHPDRLMRISSTYPSFTGGTYSAPGVYLDIRERARSFEAIAGASATRMIRSGVEQPYHIPVARVSSNCFDIIGVRPLYGRLFTEDEDRFGREDVALLDGGFWLRAFGGDPSVVGRAVVLDGKSRRIVGILPAGIRLWSFGHMDVWVPLAADPKARFGGTVFILGRLRGGVTREAAQSELDSIMRQIGREHIEDAKLGVLVEPLRESVVKNVRLTFMMLQGAVALLLLIACSNVANLLLARATSRQNEMTIRASIGAGRFRLVRQMLVESVALALAGGLAGVALATMAVPAIRSIRAFSIPRADEIAVDHTVLAVSVAVSVLSGILFGLAPAFQVWRRTPATALGRAGGNSVVGGGAYLRNALVAVQIALALILLSGAGLVTNSFLRQLNIDLGFERSDLLTVRTMLPHDKYGQERRVAFYRALAEGMKRIRGVQATTVSDNPPLQAVLLPYRLHTSGLDDGREITVLGRHIDPHYFEVLGIPMLAGRPLQQGDDMREPVPMVINRTAAQKLFGDGLPLGRRVWSRSSPRVKTAQIVGVAGDSRQLGITTEPGAQLYLPLSKGFAGCVIARTQHNAGDLAAEIRAIVHSLDPSVPVPEVTSMDAMFWNGLAQPRFYVILLGSFAGIGVALAAIGLYGLVSYTVAVRTREFGIRIALGAAPGQILRSVLALGLRLICAGSLLGLAGALASTRVLSSILHGVRHNDPLTLAGVALVLAGVAVLACALAARRATPIDPSLALRAE